MSMRDPFSLTLSYLLLNRLELFGLGSSFNMIMVFPSDFLRFFSSVQRHILILQEMPEAIAK